jgi:hypothetical protein
MLLDFKIMNKIDYFLSKKKQKKKTKRRRLLLSTKYEFMIRFQP